MTSASSGSLNWHFLMEAMNAPGALHRRALEHLSQPQDDMPSATPVPSPVRPNLDPDTSHREDGPLLLPRPSM